MKTPLTLVSTLILLATVATPVPAAGAPATGSGPANLELFRAEQAAAERQPKLVMDEAGRPALRFDGMTKSFAVYDGDVATALTSVEFRTTGKVSFAVLLRGRTGDQPAYIVFLSAGASQRGMAHLYVAKTEFTFDVDPRTEKMISRAFQYPEGEWCRLKISLTPEGDDQINIEVVIEEEFDDRELVRVSAIDDDPVREEGSVALRYYNEGASEEGTLDVRAVVFSETGN